MADERDIVEAWGVGRAIAAATPAAGAINRTLLVTTAAGRWALRAYRHAGRAVVEREHGVIAHARSRGVPAVAPLPLPDGGTILERGERFYALFPLAPGHQVPRERLGTDEAAAMGRSLAELHRALRDCPPAYVGARDLSYDREDALRELARFEALVRSLPQPTASDEHVLARIVGQRTWLEQGWAAPARPLAELRFQPIHGDFTEANLFFDGGAVSAIIDWDQTYRAPRAWEVVRTLDVALRFAPELCGAFLAAYRAVQPLPDDELDLAAAHYASLRAHDTWMYAAIYDAGNDRVRAFIGPGGFTPIELAWRELRRRGAAHARALRARRRRAG